jgi:molecular chaperone GrpE (heat shock protein)
MSWLSRWFRSRTHAAACADAEGEEETTSSAGVEVIASMVQKVARVQARQGLRIEEIEAKIEAGFSDLRSSLATTGSTAEAGLRFDDCFDAMDALDEAARVAPSVDHAQGLHIVLGRLNDFIEHAGYRRDAAVGQTVDASRFRVIGTEVDDAKPAGAVVQVARAAVLRQGKLIREGEVIVSTRSQ